MNVRTSLAILGTSALLAATVTAPAHAAVNVSGKVHSVVASKSGSTFTTTAKVRITAKKSGSTMRIATHFNPHGAASATGRTQSKTVTAKWSAKGYYEAKVTFRAKNVGKLALTASYKGKKVTASHYYRTNTKITAKSSTLIGPSKIRNAVLLRITAPKTTRTIKVSAAFNPKGSDKATGKTQRKTVKATWSSKGYYTARVVFNAKNVGVLSVSSKPVKAQTSARTTTSLVKSAISISGSRTQTVSGDVTRTVGVKPAYGRTVLVQQKWGTTWETVDTVKTSRTASSQKVKVTLRAPDEGQSVTYRVITPAQTGVLSAKSTQVTLKRPMAHAPAPAPSDLTGDGSGSGNHGGGQGSEPGEGSTPSPSPTPTAPQGAICNSFGFMGYVAPCNAPAIGYVMDRMIPGDQMGCGVTAFCIRNDEGLEYRWFNATNSNYDPTIEPLIAPDWLAHLNSHRIRAGVEPVQAFNVQTENYGYTAIGQGGLAQTHAARVIVNTVAEQRNIRNSDHVSREELNSYWSNLTGQTLTYCAENLIQGETRVTSAWLFDTWAISHGHKATMINAQFTHAAFGVVRNGQGEYIGVLQMCDVPTPEPTPEPTPGLDN